MLLALVTSYESFLFNGLPWGNITFVNRHCHDSLRLSSTSSTHKLWWNNTTCKSINGWDLTLSSAKMKSISKSSWTIDTYCNIIILRTDSSSKLNASVILSLLPLKTILGHWNNTQREKYWKWLEKRKSGKLSRRSVPKTRGRYPMTPENYQIESFCVTWLVITWYWIFRTHENLVI